MNAEDEKSSSPDRARTLTGLCLPFPMHVDGTKQETDRPVVPNPFAEIDHLNIPYTILPIKVFLYPPRLRERWSSPRESIPNVILPSDLHESYHWDTFFCHESIHLSLIDTSLTMYALLLIQFQYLAMFQCSIKAQKIFLPSLEDPLKFIAKAQVALDQIIEPVVFCHELMATTATRFLADRGKTCATLNMTLKVFYDLVGQRPPSYLSTYLDGLYFFDQSDPDIYRRWVSQLETQRWLPFYEKYENGFEPYANKYLSMSIRAIHDALLEGWHNIADSMTEDEWPQTIVSLIRYPLDPSPMPDFDISHDPEGALEILVRAASEMASEPIARLKDLLRIIGTTQIRRDVQDWTAYLREEIPDLKAMKSELNGKLVPMLKDPPLASYTKELWQAYNLPKVGELFDILYSSGGCELLYIDRFPLINNGVLPPEHLRPNLLVYQIPLLLETMRQSLICKKGVTCLCTRNYRAACKVKGVLSRFWRLVSPDLGEEVWFEQDNSWQKPVCFMDSAAGRIASLIGILQDDADAISSLIHQCEQNPEEYLPPGKFNVYDLVPKDEITPCADGGPRFSDGLRDMLIMHERILREARITTHPDMFNKLWQVHKEEELKTMIRLGTVASNIW